MWKSKRNSVKFHNESNNEDSDLVVAMAACCLLVAGFPPDIEPDCRAYGAYGSKAQKQTAAMNSEASDCESSSVGEEDLIMLHLEIQSTLT